MRSVALASFATALTLADSDAGKPWDVNMGGEHGNYGDGCSKSLVDSSFSYNSDTNGDNYCRSGKYYTTCKTVGIILPCAKWVEEAKKDKKEDVAQNAAQAR